MSGTGHATSPTTGLSALLDRCQTRLDSITKIMLPHLGGNISSSSPSAITGDLMTELSSQFAVLNTNLRETQDLCRREADLIKQDIYRRRIGELKAGYDRAKAHLDQLRQISGRSGQNEDLHLIYNKTSKHSLPHSASNYDEAQRLRSLNMDMDSMISHASQLYEQFITQGKFLKGIQRRAYDYLGGVRGGRELLQMINREGAVQRLIFWTGIFLCSLFAIYWFFIRS